VEVLRNHFDQLLSETVDWTDEIVNLVMRLPVQRTKFQPEIRAAIVKIKRPVSSGMAAEMLKAAGEECVIWVTDICNAIIKEGTSLTDHRKSCMVCKGKDDALDCGSY